MIGDGSLTPRAPEVRRLRSEGMTVREIAAATGVPAATVGDIVRGAPRWSVRRCALCGDTFVDESEPGSKVRKYCSAAHRKKAERLARQRRQATHA